MFQKPSPDIALSHAEPIRDRSHDDVETVVGPSVNVEGDFASEGNILVKGTVSGSVKTSKLLTVEDGAKIFANVRAGSAVISGEIRGNVKVDDKLELTSTAKILGDIDCAVFVVEAGCLVHGRVTMPGMEMEAEGKKRSFLSKKPKMSSMVEEPALQ